MTDHGPMKLGRTRGAAPDPRIRPLARYGVADILAPPAIDWYSRIPAWPMLANDTVGDCTVAAIGHVIQQWTTYTDAQAVVMDDAHVLAAYGAIAGYRPGDPASDRGAACSAALRYWIVAGMATPAGGPDTLTGAATLDPRDLEAVRGAIATFGALYAGLALPLSAQNEDIWRATTGAPGSWGGHCVPLVGYDATGPVCVTWGGLKRMTWAWWGVYAEEAYALLSPDWIDAQGRDPAGLDWARLAGDMAALRAG